MANRFPLVVASSTVQEIASGDALDLTNSGIVSATFINATSLTITGVSTIGIITGAINIFFAPGTEGDPRVNNIAIGRSAGILVGIMTGRNNIAMGFTNRFPCEGGHDNIVFGVDAGASLSGPHQHLGPIGVTGEYNFLAVRAAGQRMTTGSRNACIGLGAGAGIQTGNHNYCVGEDTMSLPSYLGGNDNCVFGDQAGRNLTDGDGNVVIGKQAGRSANGIGLSFTGSTNVIIGQSAGFVIRDGSNNTIVGTEAGLGVTNGGFNVFSGYRAGYVVSEGQSNVCIGSSAGSSITTGSNNVCLGQDAAVSVATTSNQIVLGNSSITNLRCNVTTISAISDVRDKKDIVDLPVGLGFVNALRPVKFEWDRRDGSMVGIQEAGFIAQELDAAQSAAGAEEYLKLVLKDNPEQLEAAPGKLIPVLVKAIQELSARVAELEAK